MPANNDSVNTSLGAQQQTLTKLLFTELPRVDILGNLTSSCVVLCVLQGQ
jgi:hypothetical protein